MKKLFVLFWVSSAGSIFADHLDSFAKIHDTIVTGNSITIVSDFSNCDTKNKKVRFIGSFKPSAIMSNDQFISFSDNHFTLNNSAYKGKPVYENVSYKLDNTGNMTITVNIINLPDYKINRTTNINCKINKGVNFYE